MNTSIYAKDDVEIAWCPGCGNFGIRNIMLKVFTELGIPKERLVYCSGIGHAAKAPQYYDISYFNGLHGRALPAASGIKAVNPDLKLIVESGDGDIYGEGGNHFIHTIRRNPDITVIVHNNMVYGLTKGQASPTSGLGMKTPIQVDGVFETPLSPLLLALTMGAPFVARASADEPEKTKEIIKEAINHKGFALVDVFQACVTFNKINTRKWYKDNTYFLEPGSHDRGNKEAALAKAREESPWPLGIIYRKETKRTFEDNLAPYIAGDRTPLYKRNRKSDIVRRLLEEKI
ncbi:MAG: thiamine pyrophosphate-dependent enzyme [Syntrophales bacterium]